MAESLLAAFIALFTATPRATPIPPRWTAAVRLENLRSIPRHLDEPRDQPPAIPPQPALTRAMLGLDGQRPEGLSRVDTCRGYLAAIAAGGRPQGTEALAAAMKLDRDCWPLVLLRGARPARRTFVRDFQLTPADLAKLPDCVLQALFDGDVDVNGPSGEWRATGHTPAELRFESSGRGTVVVTLLAWADLDHDGTEDLLLHLERTVPGARAWSSHVILTRRSPSGPLELLSAQRARPLRCTSALVPWPMDALRSRP